MRQCLLLALVAYLARATDVNMEVDGVVYSDADEAAGALGKWGVDLVDMDASLAVEGSTPNSVSINAQDVTKTARLANSAVGYVMQFGFMEAALEKTEKELKDGETFIGEEDLAKGVRLMQQFYGLPVTGELDEKTLNHMKKPRCGAKDMSYDKPNRAKRYTLSRKRWPVHTLKYWFDPEKYTADIPREKLRSEFVRALSMWSDVADVSWKEVDNEADAHVKITWDYGDHGDGYPFYGPGGTLAHAFYPTKGKLHFDDAEDFTVGTINGVNFHYVATHELGHILGLKHADNSLEDAIMYALYTGYTDNLQLHQDDIDGAVAAMGAGSGNVVPIGGDTEPTDSGPEPTVIPGPDDVPECIEKINAAIHFDHDPEYLYLFAGDWFYRLKPKNPDGGNFLPILDPDSQPKRIGVDYFIGVPRNLDAAVETLEDANKFYAFKGNNYYLFDFVSKKVVEKGTLADLWTDDAPGKIESAFTINQNTLGFLFEDKMYTYSKAGRSWNAGQAKSNYFDKYDDLDSISLAFYRSWAWAFRGMYYSVARSKNGKESSNYVLRLIKPDIKLPMCMDDAAGEINDMSSKQKKKCKKEYKKFVKNEGSGKLSEMCKFYVAEKYTEEVEWSRNDFA